ncbi:nicotinate phosphoribosyltransferase [Deinococcus ruber]|uniref:Uncharacterized protein n=1 Tax=Deinococcus ruber TaxID=1848197 RepID=A0A918C8K2_9DEIO|nr:nicotinate phosphoribosyltransferase [Deinococcus ruber]GGR11008.1 hypothetical protein GCM10008957_24740 [Deinococcus ruber]
MQLTVSGGQVTHTQPQGILSGDHIGLSSALAAQFPAYGNSVNLKQGDQPLTLDASCNGSFRAALTSLSQAAAQQALKSGADRSSVGLLTISGGQVTAVDLAAYVRAAGRQKTPPAFDSLNLDTVENEDFGTRTVNARHFTTDGQQHTALSATQRDLLTVKMMNPLNDIGDNAAQGAAHWRLRQGTADRDFSLAVLLILATQLSHSGKDVHLALLWNIPHGGDDDLTQLFA